MGDLAHEVVGVSKRKPNSIFDLTFRDQLCKGVERPVSISILCIIAEAQISTVAHSLAPILNRIRGISLACPIWPIRLPTGYQT